MLRTRLVALCSFAAVATVLGGVLVLPASAEPATPVRYRGGAATTTYTGLAFDTCEAPALSSMQAWRRSSPYRAVGVYIGGLNRGCPVQANLTPGWVSATTRMGWRLLPIYVGRQAPCRTDNRVPIRPKKAVEQGRQAGHDAASRARALGMRQGSGVYLDMENYNASVPTCRDAVLKFVSGWTRALHRRGYLSGVYANQSSGALHLAQSYDSRTLARPDALWLARWDGSSSLKGWPIASDSQWARAQRSKQYRGGHHETWGGVTINIDNDRLATPVATVARASTVTSGLRARRAPARHSRVVQRYDAGATVGVVCQTEGPRVRHSRVWDKLANGSYAPGAFVDTPGRGFSRRIPRCRFAYQVNRASGAVVHTRPSSSRPVASTLPAGALARVVCQRRGSRVGPTRVWNKLDDGRWVSDRAIATPARTGFTVAIPRC